MEEILKKIDEEIKEQQYQYDNESACCIPVPQGIIYGLNKAKEIIQLDQKTNGWISVSDRLPEEMLCKDGEYDPSDEVLCQLKNGEMKFSRYWNHRHCKETVIEQPWFDLKSWHEVVAWRKRPEAY